MDNFWGYICTVNTLQEVAILKIVALLCRNQSIIDLIKAQLSTVRPSRDSRMWKAAVSKIVLHVGILPPIVRKELVHATCTAVLELLSWKYCHESVCVSKTMDYVLSGNYVWKLDGHLDNIGTAERLYKNRIVYPFKFDMAYYDCHNNIENDYWMYDAHIIEELPRVRKLLRKYPHYNEIYHACKNRNLSARLCMYPLDSVQTFVIDSHLIRVIKENIFRAWLREFVSSGNGKFLYRCHIYLILYLVQHLSDYGMTRVCVKYGLDIAYYMIQVSEYVCSMEILNYMWTTITEPQFEWIFETVFNNVTNTKGSVSAVTHFKTFWNNSPSHLRMSQLTARTFERMSKILYVERCRKSSGTCLHLMLNDELTLAEERNTFFLTNIAILTKESSGPLDQCAIIK